MAAVSAAFSIEGFLYIAMNSFHQAAQTFTSQNLGAAKYERVNHVLRVCLLCTLVTGGVTSGLTVAFAPQLIGIYNTNPEVIAAGVRRLQIVASTYVIYGVADVLTGTIRGYAVSVAPMLINLFCTCVSRVVWIQIFSRRGIEWVHASFPMSWVLLTATLILYMLHLKRKVRAQRFAVQQPLTQ